MQAHVDLGSATAFVVLAGSTVTNTGGTRSTGTWGEPGDRGDGIPARNGDRDDPRGDSTSAQAQLDLTTAYKDAAGRTVAAVDVAGNLGGQTLPRALQVHVLARDLVGGSHARCPGDANAVFIFQMASTLTTTVGRQVILSGGAKASNIFWQVGSSATLGTTSVFKGNILALESITMYRRNTGRPGAGVEWRGDLGHQHHHDSHPIVHSDPAGGRTGRDSGKASPVPAPWERWTRAD